MILAEFWTVFLTPFGIPIAAIICVFTWLAIASISEAVSKVMCHRNDADLKLELLARGFSSEEIIGVVESGRDSAPTNSGAPHQHAHNATHRAPAH
jgi:hypothetical protein